MKQTNLAIIERDQNLRIERQERAKVEAAAVCIGVAETVALEQARGARIDPPAKDSRDPRPKPYRRLSVLQVLALPRRPGEEAELTHIQVEAGRRYAELFISLYPHSPKSCLDDSVRGSSISPGEARAKALQKLWKARRTLEGKDYEKRIQLLDAIAFDTSLSELARNDTKQRAVLLKRLCDSLDTLAAHWGIG